MNKIIKIIEKMTKYADFLVLHNIPYDTIKPYQTEILPRKPPFYVGVKPSIKYLKKHGISCAGFINILLQHVGLSTPKNFKFPKFPGGCGAYEQLDGIEFFDNSSIKSMINQINNLPNGTILGWYWQDNNKNQGHIMFLANGYIFESYYDSRSQGGIIKTSIEDIIKYFSKNLLLFEYYILPTVYIPQLMKKKKFFFS